MQPSADWSLGVQPSTDQAPAQPPADRLAELLANPSYTAILLDYDGTLSPIVPAAETAVPLPGVVQALGGLTRRFSPVAVISGRPVQYLSQRIGPVPGLELAGLYGMERAQEGRVRVAPEAERWRSSVAAACEEAARTAPTTVTVERKGLTFTLHWRAHPEGETWALDFARAQVARRGLQSQSGRMAVELRPPVRIDKGTVVHDLSRSSRAVLYMGDDVGDLPAFAALASLRAGGVLTFGVAVDGGDAPPEVAEAADLVVDGPSGALAFLERLLG